MGLWFKPVLFGFIGAIFFIVSAGMLFYGRFQSRRREKIRRRGVQISAEIISIEQTNVRIQGEYMYQVVVRAKHPRTGEELEYESHLLEEEPTHLRVGQSIPLYMLPPEYTDYFVDVS